MSFSTSDYLQAVLKMAADPRLVKENIQSNKNIMAPYLPAAAESIAGKKQKPKSAGKIGKDTVPEYQGPSPEEMRHKEFLAQQKSYQESAKAAVEDAKLQSQKAQQESQDFTDDNFRMAMSMVAAGQNPMYMTRPGGSEGLIDPSLAKIMGMPTEAMGEGAKNLASRAQDMALLQKSKMDNQVEMIKALSGYNTTSANAVMKAAGNAATQQSKNDVAIQVQNLRNSGQQAKTATDADNKFITNMTTAEKNFANWTVPITGPDGMSTENYSIRAILMNPGIDENEKYNYFKGAKVQVLNAFQDGVNPKFVNMVNMAVNKPEISEAWKSADVNALIEKFREEGASKRDVKYLQFGLKTMRDYGYTPSE